MLIIVRIPSGKVYTYKSYNQVPDYDKTDYVCEIHGHGELIWHNKPKELTNG